jgi:hypothetical protein
MLPEGADVEHSTRNLLKALGAVTLAVTLASAGCGEDEASTDGGGGITTADGGDAPGTGTGDGPPATMGDATIGQGEVGGDGPSDATLRTSGEGLLCSNNPADVPLFVCAAGLSCAAAHRPLLPDGGRAQPAYLCRVPCTPQGTCSAGVCCPAAAAGQTVYVCTPRPLCDGVD